MWCIPHSPDGGRGVLGTHVKILGRREGDGERCHPTVIDQLPLDVTTTIDRLPVMGTLYRPVRGRSSRGPGTRFSCRPFVPHRQPAPMEEVKAYLGHSSIRVTSDRYGHLFPRACAELAAAMNIPGRGKNLRGTYEDYRGTGGRFTPRARRRGPNRPLTCVFPWSRQRDSNPRPQPWQGRDVAIPRDHDRGASSSTNASARRTTVAQRSSEGRLGGMLGGSRPRPPLDAAGRTARSLSTALVAVVVPRRQSRPPGCGGRGHEPRQFVSPSSARLPGTS